MRKFLQAFPFKSLIIPSLSQNYHSNPAKSLLSLSTSYSIFSHNEAFSSTSDLNAKNSVLANYLIDSLKFSKDRAVLVSSRYSHIKSLEKTEEVVHYLKGLGLSDANIQSVAHLEPQVLFADVEKALEPKVLFFQELGLSGPCLCTLISKNPRVLKCSLDRTLRPCFLFMKKILNSNEKYKSKRQFSDALVRMLRGWSASPAMMRRMEANVLYLESCGVVGSQLSSLFVRNNRIFTLPKEKLEELVCRAVDMNFTMGSRMLARGILCLSGRIKTLNGRFEVLRMFGLSEDEHNSMFRKSPVVFGLSEEKLRSKLEFFLNNLKIDKLVVVRNPTLLSLSLEERVIPRCKVVEILKSRKLLKQDYNFTRSMYISNEQFFEEFVSRFKNDAEELLLAYKGKLVTTNGT